MDAAVLLTGGLSGATMLSLLHVPAGALIGAVLGSMSINKLADTLAQRRTVQWEGATAAVRVRQLPALVRITGQVLLGVLAGAQLNQETLVVLLRSLGPVIAAVVVLLGCTMVLARYLVARHRIDPLTAVMATAPGGISELAVIAQRQGAQMHVVLTVHLFRVLMVVVVVLPLLLYILAV